MRWCSKQLTYPSCCVIMSAGMGSKCMPQAIHNCQHHNFHLPPTTTTGQHQWHGINSSAPPLAQAWFNHDWFCVQKTYTALGSGHPSCRASHVRFCDAANCTRDVLSCDKGCALRAAHYLAMRVMLARLPSNQSYGVHHYSVHLSVMNSM